MHHVSAFVLAGGRSTRMGSDKAMLALSSGTTLLDQALTGAHQIAPNVAILGPPAKYAASGERIVEDEFPGCGPLGGIHAALGVTETDLNVILSVDMPFLPPEFFAYMVERAESSPTALVVVPRIGGIVQGACFVCRRDFRLTCEQQLRRGLYKVEDAMKIAGPVYVEEEELAERGFAADTFRNLNTPEDLAAARVKTLRQGRK